MPGYVTQLNNYLQRFQQGHAVSWVETSEGDARLTVWTVLCKVSGEIKGMGMGAKKSAAREQAAQKALLALGARTDNSD